MKCFRCGTEYTGIECPTCAQKRLSVERNRLLEKQNRELEEQRIEQRKENERQTRELEWQNELLEQERLDRENEKQQEKNKENFNARIQELSQYASERELLSAFICAKYEIGDLFEDFYFDGQEAIVKPLHMECMKDFLNITNSLDSDDRILKASDYGMCFTPEFKLGDLQRIKETHKFDFVIVPFKEMFAIFPLEMIKDKDLKGYSGKNIKIGEFNYSMFFKNKKEVSNIAKILSETSKKFNYSKNEIKNSMESYINNNPEPKSYKRDLKEPKTSIAIFVILAIIGAVVGGYIGVAYFDTDSLGMIIFAILGIFGFGYIGGKISFAIDENNKEKKRKQENKKEEESKKQIDNWRNERKQHLQKCVENILGDIKKKANGNFIAIE